MKTRIPLIQCLLATLLAVGLFSGCSRGPMEPTVENVGNVMDIMQASGSVLTAKEIREGKSSDAGRRDNARKLLVEPFEKAGFNLDKTLASYATRIREEDLTQEEAQVVMAVMAIYRETAADLARWGFIREETRDHVAAVFMK